MPPGDHLDGLTPQAPSRLLTAGPLTFTLCEGQIQCLRVGEREILRRIYVGVRDPQWHTVPAQIENVVVDSAGDGFVVRWDAVHHAGPLTLRWRGTVYGDPLGAITFTMDAEALTAFASNRIGLCVLHPIDELRGLRCWIENTAGQSVRSEFPTLIHPHLPFSNVRTMRYTYEDGTDVSLAFEGDTFETEDQRQWGDASFKTYSRPSALPKPFDVRAGQRFVQSVTVAVSGLKEGLEAWHPPDVVRVDVDGNVGHELPAIGVGWNGLPLPEPQRLRLAQAAPAFLRAEVVPARAGLVAGLQAAANEAQGLATPLVLVAHLSRSPGTEIAALTEAIDLVRPKVSSVTVMSLVDDLPSGEVIRLLKAELAVRLRGVPVGLGVHPHFTELNRHRAALSDADFAAYSWSPMVHLDDDATVIENLPTPLAASVTFRGFGGGKPLSIDRFSLRPSPKLSGTTAGAPTPRHADPRQTSLFAAGVVLGHLAIAARAGLQRTTVFDAAGPLGLVTDAGYVTPVLHVLCDIAEFEGALALKSRVSHPLQVSVLVLQRGRALRVLLANLKHAPVKVALNLGKLATSSGQLRRLGVPQWQDACTRPDGFRLAPALAWSGSEIDLGAQELVRLDLA